MGDAIGREGGRRKEGMSMASMMGESRRRQVEEREGCKNGREEKEGGKREGGGEREGRQEQEGWRTEEEMEGGMEEVKEEEGGEKEEGKEGEKEGGRDGRREEGGKSIITKGHHSPCS